MMPATEIDAGKRVLVADIVADHGQRIVLDHQIEVVADNRGLDRFVGDSLQLNVVRSLVIEHGVDGMIVQADQVSVVTSLAEQPVGAHTARERVVPVPPGFIGFKAAAQLVVTGAAKEVVGTQASAEDVVAAATIKMVGAEVAMEQVLAVAAAQDVVAGGAIERVVNGMPDRLLSLSSPRASWPSVPPSVTPSIWLVDPGTVRPTCRPGLHEARHPRRRCGIAGKTSRHLENIPAPPSAP